MLQKRLPWALFVLLLSTLSKVFQFTPPPQAELEVAEEFAVRLENAAYRLAVMLDGYPMPDVGRRVLLFVRFVVFVRFVLLFVRFVLLSFVLFVLFCLFCFDLVVLFCFGCFVLVVLFCLFCFVCLFCLFVLFCFVLIIIYFLGPPLCQGA